MSRWTETFGEHDGETRRSTRTMPVVSWDWLCDVAVRWSLYLWYYAVYPSAAVSWQVGRSSASTQPTLNQTPLTYFATPN